MNSNQPTLVNSNQLTRREMIKLCAAGVAAAAVLPGAYADSVIEPLDDGWKKLTLREKIGQTVVVKADWLAGRTDAEIAAWLEKYPVGGIFDGGEVIQSGAMPGSQAADRIKRLRGISRIPLVVCGDMESGAGANVPGLTAMITLGGVAAGGSPALAYDFGRAIALEARSAGFNWTFAPVADLVQNPFNYLVANRSCSDDPRVATPILNGIVRGYQDNAIAATAKHFPGDGVDYLNQHFTVSCNGLTRKAWNKNHGAVFQSLIDNGVMSIMAGHISLPYCQSDAEFVEGRYLPASLSHDLLTKLLKQKMGFKGVIVSDALVMGGFVKFFGAEEGSVRSFAAGMDMMLWPPAEYYVDAVEKAIHEGRIPMSRLDDAVQRVWRMKQQLGLLEPNKPGARPMSAEDQEFVKKTARTVAEKGIVLVRDRNHLLPLKTSAVRRVAIIPITENPGWMKAATDRLQAALTARGITSSVQQDSWPDVARLAAENDLLIHLVGNVSVQPTWQSSAVGDLWNCGLAGRDKSVMVSLDNPFHSDEYIAIPVYLNAYENSPTVIDALARGLFGEFTFTTKSTVNLTMFRAFDLDPRSIRAQ